MAENECKRCGLCCMTVGSTFWIHGDFGGYPELEKWQREAEPKDYDDSLPCGMLNIEDSQASCYIETCFGIEAKPEVCRDHPEEGLCQHEKLFTEIYINTDGMPSAAKDLPGPGRLFAK